MKAVSLRLLGSPGMFVDGTLHPLPLDLRSALLGVLAHHDQPVPRDHITAIFWPDTVDHAARQNLRQLVFRTRQRLGGSLLQASSSTVGLACDHDLAALRRALASGEAVVAAQLVAAPLLDGLHHLPHPEWQAWLSLERDHLRERTRRLLLEQAALWAQDGPPRGALAALATWVDADPFDDALVATYLRCAQLDPTERDAATARLARVTTALARELGASPPASVAQAAAWLRGAPGADSLQHPRDPSAGHDAGADDGVVALRAARLDLPLVGREASLRALHDLVSDAGTRLVTVHGPGGVGKTRLVRAWLEGRADTRAAATLVTLAGARDAPDAARRLSHALGWHGGDVDAVSGILERLRHGPDIVVFDEVEALPWLPTWIAHLLAGAPRLTIVTTSRERLGLPDEQVFPLSGVGVPAPGETDAPAVRLFALAARRTRPDVRLESADLVAIARFARRVEGSPLALGVAGSWSSLGPPSRFLDDLLDAEDDPLGISDVVGPSWDRLGADERAALAALSVFPERFDVEDALSVAACSRRTLRHLVDRSLVQPGTSDGLALHALVRRHAARALAERSEDAAAIRTAHARHIARRMGILATALWFGPEQHEAHRRTLARLADIRQAWSWACEHADVEALDSLADCVWSLEMRNWNALGAELTALAVRALEPLAERDPERAEVPLARMLARRGIFAQRVGDADTTQATAERALAIFRRRGLRVDPFVYFHLGIAAMYRGDLDESERWHRRLIEEAEAANDRWATAGAHGNLALLAHERGDLDEALRHARAGHTETRAIEDGWGVAIAAGNLASVMIERGEDDAGNALLLEEALYQAGRFGMESIQVEAGVLYAKVLTRLGRYDAALDAIERARGLLDAGALSDVAALARGAAPAAAFRRAIDDCLRALETASRGV